MNNLAYLNTRPATDQTVNKLSPSEYSQLKMHYEGKNRIGWFMMNVGPRPFFAIQLNGRIYHDFRH